MVNNAYVSEPAFSVGKSPSQNGTQASERISGAAGLGEGTPKVVPCTSLAANNLIMEYLYLFVDKLHSSYQIYLIFD